MTNTLFIAKNNASRYSVAALSVIVLFIISRSPHLLLHPQFVGEEASIYYPFALTHGWLQTLLQPHFGYFSLLDNLTMAVAARLSPEHAPFLTVYGALLIDFLPYLIIWFGKSGCWQGFKQKLIASMVIMLVGQTSEIWLNLVSAQFYLCLMTFLILAEEWENRSLRCIILYALLLGLSASTGVVSCFLTPLFLGRAWGGSRVAKLFAAIMMTGCMLHAGVTLWLIEQNSLLNRFPFHSLTEYAGYFCADFLNTVFFSLFSSIEMTPGMTAIVCLMIASAMAYFAKPLSGKMRILFIGGFACIAIPSLIASFNGTGGGRYAFPSSVIFVLMMQKSLFMAPPASRRFALTVILLFSVFLTGLYNYYFANAFDRRDWQINEHNLSFPSSPG